MMNQKLMINNLLFMFSQKKNTETTQRNNKNINNR